MTFNVDFQKILIDTPNISIEEQIDRYTRGFVPSIWRELCIKDYESLAGTMRDAKRVKSAHRDGENATDNGKKVSTRGCAFMHQGQVP